MLRIENGILRLIAGGASTEEIAHQLCRDVENQLPGLFCAIWRTDAAGVSKLLAAPSLSSRFTGATEGELSAPDVDLTIVGFERDERNLVADIVPIIKGLPCDPPAFPFGARACWATRVTGESGEIVGILGLYSPEPRAPTSSEVAFTTTIRELCEIAFRRQKHGEGVREADIDALTGLPSRAAFERALRTLRCDVAGAWALFVVDLDNLKTVNDIFGHKAGDDLIRIAGARIAEVMSPDATFRLGGDEFVIIIEQPGILRDLEGAAERIFGALEISALCDGQTVIPTATIGGAVLDVADTDVASVHQNADFALYHAKETGRGGFVRYWPGIGSRMIRRRTVVRDVAVAIVERRIEAHYQPVIRLDTREIVSLEALCRMRTPSGDLLSARSFKEATLDAKVATDLTSHMLSIIANDLARWRERGIPWLSVGVNVSAADFYAGDLLSKLQATFGPTGLPLGYVILEVSEGISAGSRDKVVIRQIERLRQHGVKIALDDFGSGHASLTHLLAMPVDAIKIARSFTARLWPDDPGMVIVKGLVDIARQLDIKVVAQGIETEVQASELWTMGCTHGQGFELCRPMEGKAIARLLKSGEHRPRKLVAFRSALALGRSGGRARHRA